MKSYESMVLNKTGVFPATVAKNASSGLATDGTEYIAAWVNEDWGFWQALLTAAQMTPNGIAEAYNASQKMLAMRMVFGAPGELVFDDIPAAGSYGSVTISFPGTGPNGLQPTAYQYRRVIACMGQVLQVSLYTDLANAIYCGDANNATAVSGYRTTSAVSPSTNRSTSGTYFVMPDYRGLGVRGFDPGAAHDPAGASRGLLASIQLDALQTHVHDLGGHTHNTVMGTHTHDTVIGTHIHDTVIGTHIHDTVIGTHIHDTVIGTHIHDTVMGTHTHDTVMGTHAHSTEIYGTGAGGIPALLPTAVQEGLAFSGNVPTSSVDLGTITSNTTDLGTIPSTAIDLGTIPSTAADLGTIPSTAADLGTIPSTAADLGTITSNTTDLGTIISSAASGNTGSPTTGRIDSETRMINATCNIGMRY